MSVRNKRNPYFERRNHVALAKRDTTKRTINFDGVPGEPDPGEIEDFVLVDNGDSTFSWSGSAISLIEENPDFSWAYDFSEGDGGEEENEVVEPTNPPDSVDGDPITTENETVVEGDDEITFTLEVV